MIPRNSTSRPLGVEERRRVEEQEEEQDHLKDPGFTRPITLAITSSSHVGVLCEYFARFSFSRRHAAILRRAEGCDANRTSGRSSLRALLRKSYRSGEQI